ncbi:MAG TPA: ornithine carbamoyltransferase [Gemmatimonadaceae bacterium]|jgi:ornithine carbamoyltransferase|nr:ornithine carbamoyltransferase [Gemmatimonadaceae bacterium]
MSRLPTDFLAIPDFTRAQLDGLFALAESMRAGKYKKRPLEGKTLAMIFMKASTRTRVSFEVGTFQLGGHALFLSPRDVQLGRGEPIADTARVLSRYVDGIMIRTFAHQDIEELAKYADVPVINGLTDMLHPCQVLADLLTVRAEFGGQIADKKYAWIGDGNNMANSWINAAYRFGFDLDLACPKGYEPADHLLARAQKAAKVRVLRDPTEAAEGAHVISTDVWASMGQEQEQKERERAFKGFTVSPSLMKAADKKAIFLHCLPAHRGEEVSADVIDGPQSRVWDEAENRLHVQKAVMAALMGGEALA